MREVIYSSPKLSSGVADQLSRAEAELDALVAPMQTAGDVLRALPQLAMVPSEVSGFWLSWPRRGSM